jgi:ribosomal protein S18 acetylase RimI-like enzyme
MRIVPAAEAPRDRLDAFILRAWHADFVVAHGEQIRPADLAGFVALDRDLVTGHAGYRLGDDGCELVAIAVEPRRAGIGSALIHAVIEAARAARARRVWLTTTNDNLDALRFYQRRGFRLIAIRPGVVEEARRRLKPELPPTGEYDIPMRDELDLELPL